jgi:hypothetical protein
MHAPFAKTDSFSDEVFEAAVEVRRIMELGPSESVYKRYLIKRVDGISRLVPTGANKPRTEGNEGNEG